LRLLLGSDQLARKAIAPMPEGAVGIWAPLAFVVDALLMRAAHDAVGNDDREGALVLDELKYRSDDGRIRASPVSTFQSCISLGSACSAGTMPTATFEARLRSGP
jgi:hypothetical protein